MSQREIYNPEKYLHPREIPTPQFSIPINLIFQVDVHAPTGSFTVMQDYKYLGLHSARLRETHQRRNSPYFAFVSVPHRVGHLGRSCAFPHVPLARAFSGASVYDYCVQNVVRWKTFGSVDYTIPPPRNRTPPLMGWEGHAWKSPTRRCTRDFAVLVGDHDGLEHLYGCSSTYRCDLAPKRLAAVVSPGIYRNILQPNPTAHHGTNEVRSSFSLSFPAVYEQHRRTSPARTSIFVTVLGMVSRCSTPASSTSMLGNSTSESRRPIMCVVSRWYHAVHVMEMA